MPSGRRASNPHAGHRRPPEIRPLLVLNPAKSDPMSEIHRREQFRTHLKCGRCGATGHAIWEENSALSQNGPMGVLVSISGPFARRSRQNAQGQPEITCTACGTTYPD